MSMEHTPEPWKLFTEMNSATIKRTTWHEDDPSIGDTSYVAKLNDNWICDEHGGSAHANGRRIVASVNACAGIPTEALESGVVAEAKAALRKSLSFAMAHRPKASQGHEDGCMKYTNGGADMWGCDCTICSIRAVLAKLTPQ